VGDWANPVYILSQIFIVAGFSTLGTTYFFKRRWLILCVVIGANLCFAVGYSLLGAWVGLAMCVIAIPRDITNYIIYNRRAPETRDKFNERDFYWITVWTTIMIVFTAIFQGELWTWFGFFGSYIFMISICQKNILIYRLLGIISGLCWITYNSFNESLFGVICECVLLVAVVGGIFTYLREKHKMWYNKECLKK
jgi:hypothetical protein